LTPGANSVARRNAKKAPPRRPMKCFVALPFLGFDEMFDKAIKPAVEDTFGEGTCFRGDTGAIAEVIGDRIAEEIIRADVVIAVMTGNNPNVMYEIGIAHSLRKPTLLLSDNLVDAPFDVKPQRIIKYESHPTPDLQGVKAALEKYLREIRDNPDYQASNVLTRLLGHKYFPFVDDFRGKSGWLLGYLDVLAIEGAARTVWEINPNSHWVIEDPKFIDRIIASVRSGERRYFYLIPDRPKVLQGVKNAIAEVAARLGTPADRKKVKSCLKYVAIQSAFFDLMPFSVVIYNALSAPKEAILLEPMASEIGEDQFDGQAGSNDARGTKSPHRWEERTFDVRIGDRDVIDALIGIFREQWNRGIDSECKGATATEREFLRSTWRIP
jgi:hypothetical protein